MVWYESGFRGVFSNTCLVLVGFVGVFLFVKKIFVLFVFWVLFFCLFYNRINFSDYKPDYLFCFKNRQEFWEAQGLPPPNPLLFHLIIKAKNKLVNFLDI